MATPQWGPSAQLALDTILQKPTEGIPSWLVHIMEHEQIERVAGATPGAYRREPEKVYLAMQRAAGTCLLDQFIPENPLTMGAQGYEGGGGSATTGAERIVVDDILIDSPEAVVEHMERVVFPGIRRAIEQFDEDRRVAEIVERERAVQEKFGPDILKSGYGFVSFPGFRYGSYGYVHYFCAYALYPEVMEKHFSLSADMAVLNNRAAARAYAEGGLPPLYRLDHDMADGRGTLVDEKSLDRIWLPHFERSIRPLVDAGVRLIWHCDGNLMAMVPRLLECGVSGFQGFQYEQGMDYEKICRMSTREGRDLIIIAGVSVTRELPMGTPAQVRRQIDWLVEKGPPTGLFLGCSSSMAPGVRAENIDALLEGFRHYRAHGRA